MALFYSQASYPYRGGRGDAAGDDGAGGIERYVGTGRRDQSQKPQMVRRHYHHARLAGGVSVLPGIYRQPAKQPLSSGRYAGHKNLRQF